MRRACVRFILSISHFRCSDVPPFRKVSLRKPPCRYIASLCNPKLHSLPILPYRHHWQLFIMLNRKWRGLMSDFWLGLGCVGMGWGEVRRWCGQVNPSEGGTKTEGCRGGAEHRAWQISALQNADIRAKRNRNLAAVESCPNAGQSWMPN